MQFESSEKFHKIEQGIKIGKLNSELELLYQVAEFYLQTTCSLFLGQLEIVLRIIIRVKLVVLKAGVKICLVFMGVTS